MNERIRELATQADVWCDQNVAQGSPAYNNLWEHKFAELIVRECIDTVANVSSGYKDYRSQIEEGMREWCVDAIKQHFGVET